MSDSDIDIETPLEPSENVDPKEPPLEEVSLEEMNEPTKEKARVSITQELFQRNLPPEDSLFAPSGSQSAVVDAFNSIPDADLRNDPITQKWARNVQQGSELNVYEDVLDGSVSRDGSYWEQEFEVDGKVIKSRFPRFKESNGSSGSQQTALSAIRSKLGLGTHFSVLLPHSGIFLTLSPPSELEIINLYRNITNKTIDKGRRTFGTIFDQYSSMITSSIMELIEDHIYSCTLKDWKKNGLFDHILVTDIFILVNALAVTLYPRGFVFTRVCINDPNKCGHMETNRINLSHTFLNDTSNLNKDQKKFLSNTKPDSVTIDEVTKYQDSLLGVNKGMVVLDAEDESIKLHIGVRTPSIKTYLDSSEKRLNSIESTLEETLTEEEGEEARSNLFNLFINASIMGEFQHWVESIEVIEDGDDIALVNEEEFIGKTLESFSRNSHITEQYQEKMMTFINQATFGVVAIDSYNCPKCGMDQSGDVKNDTYTEIIPLDTIKLFFLLSEREIRKIINR